MKSNKEKYNHGFKVPANYFEDLDGRLLKSISEKELPKKSGFKIPNNYFDTLDDKIISKVLHEKDSKVISLFNKKNLWYASSIAAGLFLILFLTLNRSPVDINTLNIKDIEAYISDDNLDLKTQDIAQLLKEEDIEELQLGTLSFPEETIENYLLESINDTSLLTE